MARDVQPEKAARMTLLSVVKDVCAAVGVTIPQSVFTNITGNRTMQEMLSLANEMAQRIAYDTRDWHEAEQDADLCRRRRHDRVRPAGRLQAHAADRQRLALDLAAAADVVHADTDEWLNRRAYGQYSAWGEWTMLGGQMQIYPVMPVRQSALISPTWTRTASRWPAAALGDTLPGRRR